MAHAAAAESSRGAACYLLPEGGLCNRMRAVASAAALAVERRQRLRVLWMRSPELNARFDSLFEADHLPFEVIDVRAPSRLRVNAVRGLAAASPLLGYRYVGPAGTRTGGSPETDSAVTRGRWCIRSHVSLIERPGMLDVLQPVAAIRERVAALRARLQQSVGVHVRGRDHVIAQTTSTIEAFKASLRSALARYPQAELFVATDEPAVLGEFRQAFGQRVWTLEKSSLERHVPSAIVDAAVDLYALSACRALVGSHLSSFSEIAADLGGMPCEFAGVGEPGAGLALAEARRAT